MSTTKPKPRSGKGEISGDILLVLNAFIRGATTIRQAADIAFPLKQDGYRLTSAYVARLKKKGYLAQTDRFTEPGKTKTGKGRRSARIFEPTLQRP